MGVLPWLCMIILAMPRSCQKLRLWPDLGHAGNSVIQPVTDMTWSWSSVLCLAWLCQGLRGLTKASKRIQYLFRGSIIYMVPWNAFQDHSMTKKSAIFQAMASMVLLNHSKLVLASIGRKFLFNFIIFRPNLQYGRKTVRLKPSNPSFRCAYFDILNW